MTGVGEMRVISGTVAELITPRTNRLREFTGGAACSVFP